MPEVKRFYYNKSGAGQVWVLLKSACLLSVAMKGFVPLVKPPVPKGAPSLKQESSHASSSSPIPTSAASPSKLPMNIPLPPRPPAAPSSTLPTAILPPPRVPSASTPQMAPILPMSLASTVVKPPPKVPAPVSPTISQPISPKAPAPVSLAAPASTTLLRPPPRISAPNNSMIGLDENGNPVMVPNFEKKGGGSIFSKPYFVHSSGAFTIAQLCLQLSPTSPRVFDYASSSWLDSPPADDGSGRQVLIVGPEGILPPTLSALVNAALEKKKNDSLAEDARRAKPVKMDKPPPSFKDTLGREWSEKFRDGTYVKYEHRHSRVNCNNLWLEEIEEGFAPTYWNFATNKRVSVRPAEDSKTFVMGTPLPPPPDLPAPKMPIGWVRKFASEDDEVPYYEHFRTGITTDDLILEELGIGFEGRPCYWSFTQEERFNRPPRPSYEGQIHVVDSKGKDVAVEYHDGPAERNFGYDDEDDSTTAVAGVNAKDIISDGAVSQTRLKFASASAAPKLFNNVGAARGSSVSLPSKTMSKWSGPKQRGLSATVISTSFVSAEAQAPAAVHELVHESVSNPITLNEEDAPVEFVFPSRWSKQPAGGDDFYFVSEGGESIWFLFLQIVKRNGEVLWFNCLNGVPQTERPADDPAIAIVDASGERAGAVLLDATAPVVEMHAAAFEQVQYSDAPVAELSPQEEQLQPQEQYVEPITEASQVMSSDLTPLPDGWMEVKDAEGDSFYYNTITQESDWQRPEY